jgi:hypothetical protein
LPGRFFYASAKILASISLPHVFLTPQHFQGFWQQDNILLFRSVYANMHFLIALFYKD